VTRYTGYLVKQSDIFHFILNKISLHDEYCFSAVLVSRMLPAGTSNYHRREHY